MPGEVFFDSCKISENFHKQSQRSDYDLISQKPSPNKSAQKPSKEKSKPKYYIYQGRKFRIHYNSKTKEKYIMYFEYEGKKRDIFYDPESKNLYVKIPSVIKTELTPEYFTKEWKIVKKRYVWVEGKEYEVFWNIRQKNRPLPCIFKTSADGKKEMVYIDKKNVRDPERYIFDKGKKYLVFDKYDEKGEKIEGEYVFYRELNTYGDQPVIISKDDLKKIKRVKIPDK